MAFSLPIAGYGQPAIGSQNPLLQVLLSIVGQATNGQNEAKQANESRYNDILKLFGDAKDRTMTSLDTFGQSAINDANRNYDQKRNELLTDLADRGLGGSTKRIGVETGTQRERDAEINRINDTLTQNKNAADLGFTDRAAGVMERRSDPYPDTSNVGALIAQLAPLLQGAFGGQQGYAVAPVAAYGASSAYGAVPAQQPSANYNIRPAVMPMAQTPQSKQQALADKIASINAMTTAGNAATNEQARRRGMINLTNTMQPGWVNVDNQRQALAYLVANGWAEQNPAATTNTLVDTSGAYRQPQYYPPQYPSYQPQQYNPNTGRVPLRDRDPVFASVLSQQQNGVTPWAQQNRFNATAAARQKFLNSPDNQAAIARLQAMGIGMRPNPDTPIQANGWVEQSPETSAWLFGG